MKLIILKTNLVEALSSVEGSVGIDSNLPILKHVFLGTEDNKIILISTNLETASKRIVSGKIIETGNFTIPFAVLNNIVKNLSSERVTLEKSGKDLCINTDNYEASIHGQEAKDFPIIPDVQNKKKSIKTDAGNFKEALSNVVVASQFSEIRPEISGVFFNFQNEKLTLVATDSFRLAEISLEPNAIQANLEETNVIVPLKAALELLRILNTETGQLEIFIDPNQILFQTTNNYLISRLIDGTFPDYQAILPKQTKTEATLNKQEIINAVKLAKIFSGRANDIILRVGDNKKFLEVYSADAAVGENRYRIPIKLRGEKFKIAFNWRYLFDGLKIYKGEEVVIGLNEPDRPVAIKNPNEPRVLYVVMPLKS